MMLGTRRSTSRIDICDFNVLLYRENDTNINSTKSYFLSQSPPPMTYRDLRSVMSAKIPSNIVVLPGSLNSPQRLTKTRTNSVKVNDSRKSAHRRKHQKTGNDVYRSPVRSDSRCSVLSERDITNDEMMLLANSFATDYIAPVPTTGFFHPQNLPNIQKHRSINDKNNKNRIQTAKIISKYPSLRIQHVERMRPTLPQMAHSTTPVDIEYEEKTNEMTITTTTTISSDISDKRTRKQVHIYMPQTLSC